MENMVCTKHGSISKSKYTMRENLRNFLRGLSVLLGTPQGLPLLEGRGLLPHELQVHPLQHVRRAHEAVIHLKLEASLIERRPQEVQLGVVHRREEVVEHVVAKGGGHEEEVGGLLDVADGVDLVDAPVLGLGVQIVAGVVDERVVVGGYERCEGQPVEAEAL